jgi:hypothetical protein
MPKQSKGVNKGWANLIPAKKGEVRNPAGRPPLPKCLTEARRRLGATPLPQDKARVNLPAGIQALIKQAEACFPGAIKTWTDLEGFRWLFDSLSGDAQARSQGLDRMEGKLAQPLANDPDNPLIPEHGLIDLARIRATMPDAVAVDAQRKELEAKRAVTATGNPE